MVVGRGYFSHNSSHSKNVASARRVVNLPPEKYSNSNNNNYNNNNNNNNNKRLKTFSKIITINYFKLSAF